MTAPRPSHGSAKRLRLADLIEPAARDVELSTGRVVDVPPITGVAWQLLEEIRAAESPAVADFWRLGRLLLPHVPPDEIDRLSPGEIAVVGMLACGHLNAVAALAETAAGNSAGAEPTTSSSAPATGSDISPPPSAPSPASAPRVSWPDPSIGSSGITSSSGSASG